MQNIFYFLFFCEKKLPFFFFFFLRETTHCKTTHCTRLLPWHASLNKKCWWVVLAMVGLPAQGPTDPPSNSLTHHAHPSTTCRSLKKRFLCWHKSLKKKTIQSITIIVGTQQKEKNRQRSSLMQLGVWPLEGVCHAPHSHRSCNEEMLMREGRSPSSINRCSS